MCVDSPDQQPLYPCNKVGFPRATFPTLVSFMPSVVFRGIGPGVVYNTLEETYGEPNVREREKILGYLEGSSASEDITRAESHSILGKAMDANCLEYYFTICNSLHENNVTLSKPVCFTAPPHIQSVALSATHEEYEHTPFDGHYPNRKVGCAHALAGIGQDDTQLTDTHLLTADHHTDKDVWGEPNFLTYLQTNEYPLDTPETTKHLYRKRAKSYRIWGNQIFKILADGVEREVPKPEDRSQLITDSHERTGHFGQRRTQHLLSLKYWWKGRKNDVATVLQKCDVCDRVKASFDTKHP